MPKLGDSKLPKGGPDGLAPGDYVGQLVKIGDPVVITTQWPCVTCSGKGCENCNDTGKKLQEQRAWTFRFGDRVHIERLNNSMFPGGAAKDGRTLSPSRMYEWVRGLTGLSDRKAMDNLDIADLTGIAVKIRVERNDKGYAAITKMRKAESDEAPTPVVPDEVAEEEEVPF